MEIHTIQVYPYRAGARVCQHAYPQIFSAPLSQSTLIGPGFANAHAYPPSLIQCHVDAMEIHTIQVYPYRAGARVCQHAYPQIFSAPLSQSTLIGPGFANAHAYPPSLIQCHVDAMEIHTIQVYPYRAGARVCQHAYPQIFSAPLSQSTLIGPGFANAHAYPPSLIQCHVDAMEIHTIQVYPYRAGARVCQHAYPQIFSAPLSQSTLIGPGFANAHAYPPSLIQCHVDAMEIHTIQVYPYRAGARVCQHAYPQIFSAPLSQSTLIGPGFANAHAYPPSLIQCHVDAMEIHTIQVYPYRAGARVCQHAYPQIFSAPLSQSTLIGPGFANAHAYPPSLIQCHVDAMEIHTIQVYPYRAGARVCQHAYPQIFSAPLSQSTLIGPGFANAHAYPPSLIQCHVDAMEIHTIQVYPYRAGARVCQHAYPQIFSAPLSQSTLIGPGFANAHAYPPSLIQCHVDAMEIHTIQVYPYRAGARVCQHAYPQIFSAPLSQSTLIGPGFANAHAYPPSLIQCHVDAMEIHTIQVYPYRAGARVCQHAYPQIFSAPLSQSTLIGPGFANAHAYPPSLIQCHVDAMEIHTIQVYPYRAGARVCQHAYPQIFSAPLSQSTLIGPGFANGHAYPPSLIQCHVDAMEIHTIQVYPYRAGARVCQHAYPQIFSAPLSPGFANMHIHKSFQLHYLSLPL